MMAAFVYPVWVFIARTTDRLGKGIRTGARDAMLSDEATPQTKGRVFGFHRAMDTLGAVAGPALALTYLHSYPQQYKILFVIAVIPGLLAILLTLMLKEKANITHPQPPPEKVSLFISFKYWKESPANYKKIVLGLLFFTLFNSSDLFLLLKAKEAGLTDTAVIGTYIFYNLVYAVFAYPLGHLSDKIGFRKTLILGFCFYAAVYFGMAFNDQLEGFYILFLFYGIYAAATESVAKAWITNICDKKDTATAIGTYTGFQSICTILASSFAGFIWLVFGATTTFLITAIVAMHVIVYLLLITEFPKKSIS
jgi:MFS family permease